jgi:hypothetical protein
MVQQATSAGAPAGTATSHTSSAPTAPTQAPSAQPQQQQQQQQQQDPGSLFQKGVAISVWQNSSDAASNWTSFMRRKRYFGQGHLVAAFMESNDFWNKWVYQQNAIVETVSVICILHVVESVESAFGV